MHNDFKSLHAQTQPIIYPYSQGSEVKHKVNSQELEGEVVLPLFPLSRLQLRLHPSHLHPLSFCSCPGVRLARGVRNSEWNWGWDNDSQGTDSNEGEGEGQLRLRGWAAMAPGVLGLRGLPWGKRGLGGFHRRRWYSLGSACCDGHNRTTCR